MCRVLGALERFVAAAIVVVLLTGAGAASVLQLRAPEPRGVDTPAEDFSADRAWEHLERIDLAPHPIGSPALDELRGYLRTTLEGFDGTFDEQVAPIEELGGYEARNLLIRFPGTDPTGTVLLSTHYDSVPPGPGVGDAGVSVAALVETARALAASGPMRNDVIIALVDAEEAGLYGSREFVDSHPWAAYVDLVFNFEGRGVSGPPVVPELEEPTTRLLSGVFAAVPPISTSPAVVLTVPDEYRRRISDFAHYRRLDIQGVHFAIVGESIYYHTPLDDLERSSRATVQHVGETALGLATHFGDTDLDSVRDSPDATWSVMVPGLALVAPAWSAWPLLAVAVALAALVVRQARRLADVTGRALTLGLSLPLITTLIGAILGGIGLNAVAASGSDVRTMLRDLPVNKHQLAGDLVNGHLFLWAFIALAAAGVAAVLEVARRRLGTPWLAATGVAAWTFALVVTTLIHPPTAAAFALPFILASAGTLLWLHREPEGDTGAASAAGLAVLAAPVIMMGASMTWMGYLGLTLTGAVLLCAAPAVALGQLIPQVDIVGRIHRWLPTALFATVAVVLLIIGTITRSTDPNLIRFAETSTVWGDYQPE